MADSLAEAGEQLARVGAALRRRVQERPYPMLALATVAGYVAGGGLFSSMTRPLARAALGVLLVPGVRDRLRGVAEEFRATQPTGAA